MIRMLKFRSFRKRRVGSCLPTRKAGLSCSPSSVWQLGQSRFQKFRGKGKWQSWSLRRYWAKACVGLGRMLHSGFPNILDLHHLLHHATNDEGRVGAVYF